MLQPRLLLLDEPFSALDPIARVGLYDLFVRLRDRESVTTVLVTHDIREALRLADHLVDSQRRCGATGAVPVDQVQRAPANDYVNALLTDQLGMTADRGICADLLDATFDGSRARCGGQQGFQRRLSAQRSRRASLSTPATKVERRFGLGGTLICYEALKHREIDVYIEYTGTLSRAILKLDSTPQSQN
jgi:ABC-type proline/glycine betaine transport system ATPase subunit